MTKSLQLSSSSNSTEGRALLRMGVLGASRIVRPALLEVSGALVEIAAIAAREQSRAEHFAKELGISAAYGSYSDLLEDPSVDAVYIALPTALHSEWCEAALQAGKHVLCEKPFSLSLAQAQRVVSLAEEKELLVMEAHHWRYHPLVEHAEVRIKELGALSRIEASFKVGLNNPGDIRLNPALGPGVVMDFGCYAVQWCDWLVEVNRGKFDAPKVVSAKLVEGTPGVELACEVELDYGGLIAQITCDMRDETPFRAFIDCAGEGGNFHFENPLGISGSKLSGTAGEILPTANAQGTYRRQLQAFVDALSSGEMPPTSAATILRTQQTLDAIYEKAKLISRVDLRQRALQAPSESTT